MIGMQFLQAGPVNHNSLEAREIPLPEPGPGQLRLRVLACGVCHTDLHIVEGEICPPQLPITPGHQVVGIVDQLGEGAGARFQIGDRVGVPWLHSACGDCEFCQRRQENLCAKARFTGFHVDGGFAGWLLAEARWVLPLPLTLSNEQAAPLLCAGMIGYRSLRLADVQPGERLALVGFGASAHLAIQIARRWNCEVAVITRSANHRMHAESLGACWTGGIDDQLPWLMDRAVIFAPSGDLVPKTLSLLRRGGTLAVNAVYMTDIPSMTYATIYGERTIRSVSNATYQDGLDILRIAGEMGLHSSVSTFRLEEVNQALQDLKKSHFDGEAVLLI